MTDADLLRYAEYVPGLVAEIERLRAANKYASGGVPWVHHEAILGMVERDEAWLNAEQEQGVPIDRALARLADACDNLRSLHGDYAKLLDEAERLRSQLSEAKLALEMSQAERNRLLDDRDKTMIAVVNGTAERIASDIEALGQTAHPMIFKGIAERIRSGAWRDK